MRTRLTAVEKPNRKRMAALVTVYDAEPAPRRPHDVLAPPGGRHGSRPIMMLNDFARTRLACPAALPPVTAG